MVRRYRTELAKHPCIDGSEFTEELYCGEMIHFEEDYRMNHEMDPDDIVRTKFVGGP